MNLQDCPSEAGDFRAQQCSAYNDVKYQGHFYEWVPVYGDSGSPCALKCQALGKPLTVELAPKVLDGTRCNAKSLDMCISGVCQVLHDACGVKIHETLFGFKRYNLFAVLLGSAEYGL
uniref:ADAMTS-like protein 3 n=1 Tax=Sphaerodactylus townsendi TaxID=933632 RepID=A0ACB8E620_9SAUR